ncbi:MAG: diguanylate cyclase [Magnetococcales bacterium]|nr:diguanylate cyclase [Magnetococcales bacterium]
MGKNSKKYKGESYRKLSLFRDVPYNTVKNILEKCEISSLAKGDVVLSSGCINNHLYLVLQGRLSVHLSSIDAPSIANINVGGCVGELSLIDEKQATAFVKVAKKAKILVIEKNKFREMTTRSHELVFNLLRVFSNRMRFNTEALVESQFVRTVPDIIYRLDKEGKIVFLNDSIKNLGYEVDELLGCHFNELLDQDEVNKVSFNQVISNLSQPSSHPSEPPKLFDERRSDHRKTTGLELLLKTKIKREVSPDQAEVVPPNMIIADISCTGISQGLGDSDQEEYEGTIGIIRDITERKMYQAQLADQKLRMEAIFETMSDALIVINADGIIESVNDSAIQMFGYGEDEIIGSNVKMLMPSPQSEEHDSYIKRYFDTGEARMIDQRREMKGLRKDGREFHLDVAISVVRLRNRVLFTGIIRDITERKEAERLIQYQANYDALTDLPNRAFFLQTLKVVVFNSKDSNSATALLFIDLDRFKWVNDNLGHAAGDALLQMAAKRISSCVEEGDVVARLGGDEFTALLVNNVDINSVAKVTKNILDQLNMAFMLEGEEVYISGSIGVALLPEDTDNTEDLLKLADEAMYKSKKAGRNAYHFHSGKSFIQPKKY